MRRFLGCRLSVSTRDFQQLQWTQNYSEHFGFATTKAAILVFKFTTISSQASKNTALVEYFPSNPRLYQTTLLLFQDLCYKQKSAQYSKIHFLNLPKV